ncbi:MAG: hypothetical protein J6386_26035 [Candidatus Synoicihabitans palmerolidicus]|nr:hypothetical protein [Candidatus Synoicihabitans palmerolidicus]MCC5025192.1 hypothetical protein [Candidatus Synoicihabitans palmerolidicus]MCC5025741.1 hypothetical protein [Candidatus Synoicihabitans palmerolidicus]MCC5025870.1 hypothetical protein [Candidatus Synoicihabitans palmerolidicus]MCC5025883.1 hypothetical protein [Candidatus Synoicihabitans palmerolidicus]
MNVPMDPESQRILEIVKANLLEVVFDLNPDDIVPESNMTDLGANSIDRVEVVMYASEALQVNVPTVELHGASTLADLVEIFKRHTSDRSR